MRGRKRSLSQTGGKCRIGGDPGRARVLEYCLNVSPRQDLPLTHGFHAYPARMHPETARRAIRSFAPLRVFDPFVGSGTTALEALWAGVSFAGRDISRVAVEIAWTRTRNLPSFRSHALQKAGHRAARRAEELKDREFEMPPWAKAEREWYWIPHLLREVCALKLRVDEEEDEELRRLLRCVLSSLVVKLSMQESDGNPQKGKRFKAWPPGQGCRLFRDKATELSKDLRDLSVDLHRRGLPYVAPDLAVADARHAAVPGASFDLVLTSPPYAGTYDYAYQHARRYPLFDDDGSLVARCEIGARRRVMNRPEGLREYRQDMAAAMERVFAALAPGGRLLMLIGDGTAGGKPVWARTLIAGLAEALGGKLKAWASQRRRDWSGGPPRYEHLLQIEKE